MSEIGSKPPTQSVSVAGFKADLYAADEVKIDWNTLLNIPKFQMYATEKTGRSIGNVMEWIVDFMHQEVNQRGEQVAFQDYSMWHDKKGYWKNEDVYGALIEVKENDG